MSVLSIAYSSVTISIEFDCTPVKRRIAPHFYGYIPDDARRRFIVFLAMVMLSALHITLKVLGVALLATLGPAIVCGILGGDVLIYHSYKVLRNDWICFFRVEGALAIVTSFMLRSFEKVLTDFSASICLRHPSLMGGLYWSINLILGHILTFVAVYLYIALYTGDNSIRPSLLWTLAALLEGFFFFSFAVFLRTIDKAYISTFFTTTTGPQFVYEIYHRATNDESRFFVMSFRASYYASYKEEVRVWLSDNWTRWTVDEKPDWFTPRLLASIPEDLLPKNTTQETKELRRRSIQEMRRKSIAGITDE